MTVRQVARKREGVAVVTVRQVARRGVTEGQSVWEMVRRVAKIRDATDKPVNRRSEKLLTGKKGGCVSGRKDSILNRSLFILTLKLSRSQY